MKEIKIIFIFLGIGILIKLVGPNITVALLMFWIAIYLEHQDY